MRLPFELSSPPESAKSQEQNPPLRVLLAERPGGKLTHFITDFPISLPVDFEVEDDLMVVASLGAQNVFDIIVIGESLFGRQVPPETVQSLADAAHTTPILIVGKLDAEQDGETLTGDLRMICPRQLSASSLLREIRQTLEVFVTKRPMDGQRRRIQCLAQIFDHLLERMPYAVAVTDENGDICSLNRAASSYWHRPTDQIVGTHLLDDPASADSCTLMLGPEHCPVDASSEPFQWLGGRYFLTSLTRSRNGGGENGHSSGNGHVSHSYQD